jgi:hypothetical protein
MGPRYVLFRAWWELRRRTGLLAREFPTNPPRQDFISLQDWLRGSAFLLPNDVLAAVPALPEQEREKLQAEAERIRDGEVRFFSSTWYSLGPDWNWHTHPETGYKYPSIHWTQIEDFSARAGDIKFVWEKARFSWIYTLARADAHHASGQADSGAFVFEQIAHFLRHNPINRGPQYRCSQEISLRILAWSFALSYWRHHPALTDRLFADIMHSVRWQLNHVRAAIHFSRIAVRNNHSITETALLAMAQRLFPFLPESAAWAQEGQAWLQEEIEYQFYKGGGYIQHSTNYHRVAVQTLTVVLSSAGLGPDFLPEALQKRLLASLQLLLALQDQPSGWLPNLGNNDGALFFPLSSAHFRDYRPALHALAAALGQPSPYVDTGTWQEEAAWWGLQPVPGAPMAAPTVFCEDGYAVMHHNQGRTLTFLRAAAYIDRPAQADNLHLDVWNAGRNLLRDSGTYKYNTDPTTLSRFAGAAGHNTVTLGQHDHMQKGPRFIWYYWPQDADLQVDPAANTLTARVQAFLHLTPGGVQLQRTVHIDPSGPIWTIEDEADQNLGMPLRQHWHPADGYEDVLEITATDPDSGQVLEPEQEQGLYSSFYGRKQETPHIVFSTSGLRIRTQIRLKKNIQPGLYPDQPRED